MLRKSLFLLVFFGAWCLATQMACDGEDTDDDSSTDSGQAQDDDASPVDDDASGDDDDDNDNDNDDDNDDASPGDDDDDDDNNDNDDLTPPATLKAMTFNLRTGFALDGENSWIFRKEMVAAVVAQESPAIMGTQEGWGYQLNYIRNNVPGYAWDGLSRFGNQLGEYSAVFHRTDLFELLETGTFWLSDTPDVPRSKFSANQEFPRIVTWAELEAKADGFRFFVFNTHFDTTDLDEVPQKSAALIVRQLAAIAGEAPVIVTGDFNEAVGDPAYRILTGTLVYEGVTGNLIDPWVVLGLTEEGTAHGFTGVAPGPTRIDWILCSAHFTPTGGWINRYAEDGLYPSDHFPVVVEFAWPE